MRKCFYILFLLLSLSCEDEVNLKLNVAEPVIVIDATIEEKVPCNVKLSKSQGFWDNSPYEKISGARIMLRVEGVDEPEILSEREEGLYTSKMLGVTNAKYSLEVNIDGKTYTSKAQLPPVVPIDSIYIYNIQPGSESWYSPCIVFHDTPAIPNYYYTIVYVNDNVMRSIFINDDQFRDGLEVHRILYFNKEDNGDEELKLGDTVRVKMESINEGTYKFYNSINHGAGGNNPVSSFSGGAYGNFKAFSSSSIEMTITEDRIHTVK